MKPFLVDFHKGVMNNALWIPGWKVTEHKNQDSSVKLILPGKEAENIHPLCAGCTASLIFRENMSTFSPCREILKRKHPQCALQCSSKPRGCPSSETCQEPTGSALLEPLHSQVLLQHVHSNYIEIYHPDTQKSCFTSGLNSGLSTNTQNIPRPFVFRVPQCSQHTAQNNAVRSN